MLHKILHIYFLHTVLSRLPFVYQVGQKFLWCMEEMDDISVIRSDILNDDMSIGTGI